MKKTLLLLSSVFTIAFTYAQNGLDSVFVETYYISDANDATFSTTNATGDLPAGSVAYRVFVDMKPGYNFQALYAILDNAGATPVPLHTLRITTTTKFFNNEDRGATSPNSITVTNMKKNTNMLDSWFSVGAAASGKMGLPKEEDTDGTIGNTDGILKSLDPLAGIPINAGTNPQDGMVTGTPVTVTFVGLSSELDVFDAISQMKDTFRTENGSIAALGGATGPNATNRVLVGQFTTDGQLCYELNVQLGTPGGGVESWVAKNPQAGEFTHPSLIGCVHTLPTNIMEKSSSPVLFSFYPNPAHDKFTIQAYKSSENSSNHYVIYNLDGKTVAEKQLGKISEKQTETINISSLPSGIYVIELTIDGISSHEKIIKD